MFRRRRLSFYLLSEFAGPTFLGLSVYGFVILMNAFLLVARVALAKSLSAGMVFRLFLYEVPPLLVLVIPMATILGIMIAFGRLSADHETTALQSAGVGPTKLLGPVIVHGAVAACVSFLIYAVVVPRTTYAQRLLNNRVLLSGSMGSNMSPRVFYSDIPGYVLFASEIRPGSRGRLEGVFVHQEKYEGDQSLTCLSLEADLYRPAGSEGQFVADLRHGVCDVYRTDKPENYHFSNFERYQLPIEPPAYYKVLSTPPDRVVQNMSFVELFPELTDAAATKDKALRDYRIRSTLIEIQQRIALPIACLLFAILGMPLGMTRARSGKGASFALSVLVILVYWVVFTSTRDQASQGRLPPFAGVWAANLIIGVWASYAFWRLRRGASAGEGFLRRTAARAASMARRLTAPRRPQRAVTAGAGAGTGNGAAAAITLSSPYRAISLMDRHVGIHFLRVLFYALLSAYAVFAVVDLKEILDGALRNRRPLGMMFEYFKYFAPGKLGLVLPVACLVAGVVAFTILGRNGELTAMKAGGISMRRSTVPVLILTLGLCVLLFLVQNFIAPVTNQRAQEVRDLIQGKPPRTYGMSAGGRWTFGTGGRLYHYSLYDPDHLTFQGLSVFTIDRTVPRVIEHRFATLARWNGNAWVMERGWCYTFPAGKDQPVTFRKFESGEVCVLDPPDNFARREITLAVGGDLPDQMDVAELSKQIATLQDSGYDSTRLKVAFYSKFAQPLTPFVMVLLGLPFAFQVGRRGSLYGIGVALILVIVYWATFAVFNALGLETVLPPLLAAWAPNVLYAFVGTYLLLFIRT